MTAEEQAAVEWLESIDLRERAEHFVAPINLMHGQMFTVKGDHETRAGGYCHVCFVSQQDGTLVVIE